MGFTDELETRAEPVWESILEHPMVVELGEGTLDEEPFRYFIRQDYRYLIDNARALAQGTAKAPDYERMTTFAELLTLTVDFEMDLHRSYAQEFGIPEAELEATEPSPTTRGYTDFLLRIGATGTFGEIVAALLPCMWTFNETGKRLAENGLPDDERYATWVQTYAGDEYTELTRAAEDIMDDLAADASQEERERYRSLFETGVRYEYRFWDAAWRQEEWSV
ncbi:thiaminase II [Halanaeroarchaeum sulfurireducens]|uniref:Transcriptional activator TenA n=1 Tax=Halanaeroarchaeum sulfurireducens TaxID=1604004 RepID=A0A0F7PCY7_9EURY|nr:thiaminase II [Halanaeroarchaeum sulfurireducens]AKH98035.1 transcriptional activator TenA [Halanaeroarchaeum sulfurireducens]ALG82429.1 transcriptional activator TenA [Halanaeroarchaeum sulfurireducens]